MRSVIFFLRPACRWDVKKKRGYQYRVEKKGCVRLGDLAMGVVVRFKGIVGRIVWLTAGGVQIRDASQIYHLSPECDVEVVRE